MTAPFSTVIYEKQCGVAHVSLNRPNRLNAYSVAMRDDLSEILHAVEFDDEVHALLITGQGRAFCTGADLSEFGTAPSQVIARTVRWERDVWGQLINLTKPIVAAVHGYCIGSGVEITLLADVRIAASATVFAMPELQLGMIPAAGGSQTLPLSIGASNALDLLYTGRRFDAIEAERIGIVSRVVPEDVLLDSAWDIAGALATISPDVVVATRTALREGHDSTFESGIAREQRLSAMLMGNLN